MHAFIIKTDQPSTLSQAQACSDLNLEGNHPDLLVIKPQEKESIGVSEIRDMQVFLSLPPLKAPSKVVLISQAHTLTPVAQNALLKSLEEPPAGAKIILLTKTTTALLPTILSRCQIVNSKNMAKIEPVKDLNQLQALLNQKSLGAKIEAAQKFTKKESALLLVQHLTQVLQQQLHQQPTTTTLKQLRVLQQAHTRLGANTNPQLIIEHLFLNL